MPFFFPQGVRFNTGVEVLNLWAMQRNCAVADCVMHKIQSCSFQWNSRVKICHFLEGGIKGVVEAGITICTGCI